MTLPRSDDAYGRRASPGQRRSLTRLEVVWGATGERPVGLPFLPMRNS